MKKTIMILIGLSFFSSFQVSASLATVNGKAITEDDLRGAIGALTQGQKDYVLRDVSARKRVLKNVIEQELLLQEGKKLQIENTKEYKNALEEFKKQLVVNQLVQKEVGSRITESSVKKYYKANKSRYATDQVHAWHILVETEKEAYEILKTLKKGEDFKALAEKVSKDPSAKTNRGDLGFFTRDRMVPEFTQPVFKAKKGSFVGPIKTLFGYHIVKVIDKKHGKMLEFDEVEARVQAEMQRNLLSAYVEKLTSSAKIEINEEAIKNLK